MLFVLIMLFVLAAVLAPRATLHKRTALVIAPNGDLVEQYRSDPGSRALARFLGEDVPEVQLRDVLKAIKAATGDDRIERIVLRADTLVVRGRGGWPRSPNGSPSSPPPPRGA